MRIFVGMFCIGFLVLGAAARADDVLNCKHPDSQEAMVQCSALDFEKADKALNAIWPKQKAGAESSDKGTGKMEYADALAVV